MSIIDKILIINTVRLPDEILDYIKSFIFHDIMHKSRKIKNNIISLINSNLNSQHYSMAMAIPSMWVFIVIQNDIKNYKSLDELNIIFKMSEFCLKCGNYYLRVNLRADKKTKQNIICKCKCDLLL